MADERLKDLKTFYSLIGLLEHKLGGPRTLAGCSAQLGWPRRGVYFFMESGEQRDASGNGPRIVRVGTHALKEGSGTKLWTRLSQHRGQGKSGGGNHRGSIFRLIVGASLIERDGYKHGTWGQRGNAGADVRASEIELEREVSRIIGKMPFVWLAADDEPNADSLRGYMERNAIALLSNFGKDAIDPPSKGWLGRFCNRERVRESGLWNSNHVNERYDPAFLTCMHNLVKSMEYSR